MNETTKKYLAWLIVVVAILVAGYLGVVYPIPAPPVVEPQALTTGGIKCHSVGPIGNCVEIWNGGDVRIYSNQGTTSKFAVDGATGDTTVAGNLAVSGSTVNGGVIGNNTAITGTLTVTGTSHLIGAATFDGMPVFSSGGAIPTTVGLYITPTALLWTLTPGGNVEVTMAACTSGQSTVLYDAANFAIVITDTGNFVGAGDQTLGQYDTLPLVCIGSKWIQVGPVSAN